MENDNYDALDGVMLGFEEEEISDPSLIADANNEIDYNALYEKKTEVYIPDYIERKIKDEFDCSVVNDFGDMYHMSDEEKKKINKYIDLFNIHHSDLDHPKKLSKYIVALKHALDCLDAVAADNRFYEPDEFKKLFFKGKIKIYGLTMPKYRGKDKKRINYEYIIEFLLSGNDPADFKFPNSHDKSIKELSDKSKFSKKQLKKLQTEFENDKANGMKNEIFYEIGDYGTDEREYISDVDGKDLRKILNKFPDLAFGVKDFRKRCITMASIAESTEYIHQYGSDMFMEDLETISRYDNKYGYESNSDRPVFKGDVSNKKDVDKYLSKVHDWEMNHVKFNYNGKMKTQSEINDIECKQVLERAGWNIRKLYGNSEKERKLKRIKKEKEKIKRLKKRLSNAQSRKKRTMKDYGSSSKKGKKSKKK